MNTIEHNQLDDLLDVESGLTDWELKFIEDLDSRWRDRELSDKQAATLEKIYERRVP